MSEWFEKIWHRTLGRPFILEKRIDVGKGETVVFLHGIGASAENWRPVIQKLDQTRFRSVAFDLLGFGRSPKTTLIQYTVDDHVASVVASLKRARIRKPFVLVGHSMGCLVAARLTRLYPELVKHLVLYQVPVYGDSDQPKLKDLRYGAYLSLYETLVDNPDKTLRLAQVLGRATSRFVGLERLDEKSWYPFEQSMRNTIISQRVIEDLQQAECEIDVVYGQFDVFVLTRGMRKAFKHAERIAFHRIKESHRITSRTATILVKLIDSSGTSL